MERIYKALEEYSEDVIKNLLRRGQTEELIRLPLSVGFYHPNWKFAQDVCIRLAQHDDPRIRANSVFGLAHIARTKGKLEKHIVKPILLNELRNNLEYQGIILDAISDINLFLKWNMAAKKR